MEHDIPFGNSNRENGPTFLDFPLFLGIFQWDEPTKRVPFTAEPEIPEILTKWKAPLLSVWLATRSEFAALTLVWQEKVLIFGQIINPSSYQACSVKMGEYWPRSCIWTETRSIKNANRQYPAILISRLVYNSYIKPNFWHLISIHQEFKTLFEFESTETQQYLDWQMKIPHFWCEKTKIMTGIKCATSRNRPAL